MFRLIITADDLGIDPQINRAIADCFQNGTITSTSLLVNAPSSQEGIHIAKENPGLEIGLHLSIVEGISLRGTKSSITDNSRYFDGICLHRNWKIFLKHYFNGNINFNELEEELELQVIEFLKYRSDIPFVNGTQHMHLLPKVWKIILKLAQKYQIKAIRTPTLEIPNKFWLNSRVFVLIPFSILGHMAKKSLVTTSVKTTDRVIGMQYSGQMSQGIFNEIIKGLMPEISYELIMHPGYHSTSLRENLKENYQKFNWDLERETLMSKETQRILKDKNVQLINFSDL